MKNPKNVQQVEKALNALFDRYDVQKKVCIEDIKKWVFYATGDVIKASNLFHKKCLNLFPPAKSVDEMQNIMQVFVDAWNFFPHKELDGKSPDEMCREMCEQDPELESELEPPGTKAKKKMPKVIVGGHEMEFDQFQLMLKQMEKEQEPFKKWIGKDALPKYKKYLAQTVKLKKVCEEHYGVADLFFQRVLHVGFLELKDIRPNFIRSEFPNWWPSHVMYSDLKPGEVKKSLELLFDFIRCQMEKSE